MFCSRVHFGLDPHEFSWVVRFVCPTAAFTSGRSGSHERPSGATHVSRRASVKTSVGVRAGSRREPHTLNTSSSTSSSLLAAGSQSAQTDESKTLEAWNLTLLGRRVNVDTCGFWEPNLAEVRLGSTATSDRFADIQALRPVPKDIYAIAMVDFVGEPLPKGPLLFPPTAAFASRNVPLLMLVDGGDEFSTSILRGQAFTGQFLELANASRDLCSVELGGPTWTRFADKRSQPVRTLMEEIIQVSIER
jgi:hypothetical protein